VIERWSDAAMDAGQSDLTHTLHSLYPSYRLVPSSNSRRRHTYYPLMFHLINTPPVHKPLECLQHNDDYLLVCRYKCLPRSSRSNSRTPKHTHANNLQILFANQNCKRKRVGWVKRKVKCMSTLYLGLTKKRSDKGLFRIIQIGR
jgi:hypothetical protein